MTEASREERIGRVRELLEAGEYASAEALIREVVREIQLTAGSDAPDLIVPLYLYAKSISGQHSWNVFHQEEEDALTRSLEIATHVYGEDSPRSLSIRETLAICLRAADRTPSAIEHMEFVVRVKQRVRVDNVILAHALNGLAEMYVDVERYAEAESLYERSFRMAGNQGDEIMDLVIWLGRARALMGMGLHAEAAPLLERAQGWVQQKYGATGRRAKELETWLDLARRGVGGDPGKLPTS